MSISNWFVGFKTVKVLFTGHDILISVEEVNKSVGFAIVAYSIAKLIGDVKWSLLSIER